MGETSAIQWTNKTWNPWHGCTKVSEGCKFCYMYRDKERYGQDPKNVLRSKTTFRDPMRWKDPAMVFTCSWSDWFIEDADEWRPEAWQIIKDTPHLTYQILTKRPENIAESLPDDWGKGYRNVWLGVSVENHANRWRIEYLKDAPARTKFISFEPLIGFIAIPNVVGIDWTIIGGESGNENGYYKYRPCQIHWIEALIEYCKADKAKVFVKQLGTHLAKEMQLKDSHGGDIAEWPENLRIREFPR